MLFIKISDAVPDMKRVLLVVAFWHYYSPDVQLITQLRAHEAAKKTGRENLSWIILLCSLSSLNFDHLSGYFLAQIWIMIFWGHFKG